MTVWVDADACPKAIKTVLFRAAMRTKVALILVANHHCQIPSAPNIRAIKVSHGFDVADELIVDSLSPGDLVITGDIPLADAVITKKGLALTPRGELYNDKNIKQVLAVRDFNQSMRDCGMISGGAGKLGAKDIQSFSNQLDRFLTANS